MSPICFPYHSTCPPSFGLFLEQDVGVAAPGGPEPPAEPRPAAAGTARTAHGGAAAAAEVALAVAAVAGAWRGGGEEGCGGWFRNPGGFRLHPRINKRWWILVLAPK